MRIVDIRETAIPLKSNLAQFELRFLRDDDLGGRGRSPTSCATASRSAASPSTRPAATPAARRCARASSRASCTPSPTSLLDEAGDNLDPDKILACMMQRREVRRPHASARSASAPSRSRCGTRSPRSPDKPLHRAAGRALQRRQGAGQGVLLCRRRLVRAGQDHQGPAGRDAPPSRCRLHHGEDEGRRRCRSPRTCGRIEAVKSMLPASARSSRSTPIRKFDRDEALAYAKALAPFKLRWFEEPCDPLDFALLAEIADAYAPPLVDRRKPVLDPGRREPGALRRPEAPSAATSSRSTRRRPTASRNTPARSPCSKRHGWPRASLFPHGGNQMSLAIAAGFGLGGAESYPGVFGDFGGFADDAKIENGYHHAVRPPRHRLRGAGARSIGSCANWRGCNPLRCHARA